MKSKEKFVLLVKFYDEYYTLNIIYIYIYIWILYIYEYGSMDSIVLWIFASSNFP